MQAILIIYAALLLAVFLLPLLDRVFNFGNAVGIALGALFLALGLMWNSISFTLQKLTAFGALAFGVIFWLLGALLVRDGRSTANGQKVIVVLGCRVNGDVPSIALQKRVDCAYLYLMSNPGSVAILSGGRGRDELISEAACMKNMLVSRGIPENRLITEDKSVSTYQNIKFSKKYIKELGTDEIAVATSEYHQKRASLICKKFGLTAYPVSAKTAPRLLPTFILRELFALINEYASSLREK